MRVLIVAPHADDELLGCGGTLLKKLSNGDTLGWLLMTTVSEENGWDQVPAERRRLEIDSVRSSLSICKDNLYQLNYPPATLDQHPLNELVGRISCVVNDFKPQEIYLPHPGDIHSDHKITFSAASACTKWFRHPSLERVFTYETISETDFGFNHLTPSFCPNTFVDISPFLDSKLKLLSTYRSEISSAPFPRSLEAVKAQSLLRGVQRGVMAAEAFELLRQYC